MKRSNPRRSVPHRLHTDGEQVNSGKTAAAFQADTERNRSRTDFRGSSARRAVRIAGENGSMPVNSPDPKRPPVLVLYEDLVPKPRPAPRYGQYPLGLIPKLLPWLRCARHEILHVCSGCLPPGEGIRVDIDPGARPDVIADGRHLPFRDGSIAAVLLDPPYSAHYAREFYGVEYPRPSHLLREAARVVRPGGRVGFVHYITPKAPKVDGRPVLTFVKAFGLSTGFDMPMRAVTIFERPQPELDLGGPP